jgi:hypothetical protein
VSVFAAKCLSAQSTVTVRILMGLGDEAVVRWDGTVQAHGVRLVSIEPWRFEGTDGIVDSTWHVSTHPVRLFNSGTQVSSRGVSNIVANGLLFNLTDAGSGAELSITTAQGDFTVRLDELGYGSPVAKLNGRVLADRIPPSMQITNTKEEEDFPSATVNKAGDTWVAYIQFHHNPRHNELRAALDVRPSDFSKWKLPTGGDQVFLRKYSGGKWGEPVAVTTPGLDIYRTAIAVDGHDRPWIFWSENVRFASGAKPNFEVFGRALNGAQLGPRIQISNDPGNDVDPVAATDASGNVWIAWQGWRNGKAAVFAATQSRDGFTKPQSVSSSIANEWNPAIAADGTGRVTVAWDSYRNENYDVYLRTAVNGQWGAETPAAATPRYEAYPSLSYEKSGRLWLAYEEGGAQWGKDFGAYNTNGMALYQGRLIRLRGFEPDGRVVETEADPGQVLPGYPSVLVDKSGIQDEYQSLDPDPKNAPARDPDRPASNGKNARNTSPRLAVDASGRLWLAFRSAHPIFWSPLGTVWTEHVVSFDGHTWSKPIYIHHSDNLLDNRPAVVSPAAGQILVIGSSDHRRDYQRGENVSSPLGLTPVKREVPYNNDLFVSDLRLPPVSTPLTVRTAGVSNAPAITADKTDLGMVKTLRDYKIDAAGGLKIVRGEFHRHSEISMDGGFDGSIIDQYRYAIDAGAMDWVGCCDHDNGAGREYTWWLSQKLTDVFYTPGKFVSMFSYERSVVYPEGHRNLVFAQRGVRTLPRQPVTREDQPGPAPDTQTLYAYLKFFNGIAASHTSATSMGTDWRDNDPRAEPVVEIYQGDRQNYEMPDAPRSPNEKDSIGNWRPKGFVSIALEKGYKLGFQASSDHVSTHMSYCNLLAKDLSRESILEAFQKRHIYGATDNILADVRSGPYIMGDVFSTNEMPKLHVKLDGTSKFSKVVIVRNNRYVYSSNPGSDRVDFTWLDNAPDRGKSAYYYVRGEQDNGEIVWASPMWITYTGK